MNKEEIEKNIRKCKNCNTEFYSVKEEFKCTKCGYINCVEEYKSKSGKSD